MREKILYAGYGANRDILMMKAIIGDNPKVLGPAMINDVELCVQRFDQITDKILNSAPAPISPRQIMTRAWGNKSSFETYAIRRKEGSRVDAMIFELSQFQRDFVAEWELVEFGWYNHMSVNAVLRNGKELKVVTEGFAKGQAIDRVVDGQNYETFLADQTIILNTAEKTRQDYIRRHQSN